MRRCYNRYNLVRRRKSLVDARRIMRLTDGIVADIVKHKALTLIMGMFFKPKDTVEDQSEFKSLMKRMFQLVTAGTKDSLMKAILMSKAPTIFMLLLSGAGAVSLVTLTLLLRKLYKLTVGKQQ